MHTGSRLVGGYWMTRLCAQKCFIELRLELSSETPVYGTTNLLFDEVRIHAYKTPKSDNIGTTYI